MLWNHDPTDQIWFVTSDSSKANEPPFETSLHRAWWYAIIYNRVYQNPLKILKTPVRNPSWRMKIVWCISDMTTTSTLNSFEKDRTADWSSWEKQRLSQQWTFKDPPGYWRFWFGVRLLSILTSRENVPLWWWSRQEAQKRDGWFQVLHEIQGVSFFVVHFNYLFPSSCEVRLWWELCTWLYHNTIVTRFCKADRCICIKRMNGAKT